MNIKRFLIGSAASAIMLGATIVPAFASTETVYDALPSVSPETNYPSQPFQAQQVYEFGDLIHLGGINRSLNSVTVTMSDWAKYSDYTSDTRYSGNSVNWTHPITLNVYNVVPGTPNTVGTLLGTVTQTITIPWRPESDSTCGSTSNGTGWKKDGVCYNYSGIAFNATFDMSSLNVTLPNDVIVTVAFNTQSYGDIPMGINGPYNSLNVAIPNNQSVSVGTDDPDSVFLDSTWSGAFVNGSLAGLGLKEDSGWTPNGTVALQVTVNVPVVRTAEITSPTSGQEVSGIVNFAASLTDDDADAIQWAVRAGTCAAGTNTVFGNVDGHSDSATINQTDLANQTFSFSGDMSAMTAGLYCFIYNPVEDSGESNIRLTVEFNLVEPSVEPVLTNKEQCKEGGWETFGFRNQGLCIQYVNTGKDSR